MLYYDRIDVSEGIDFNKTNTLKECNICHIGIKKGKLQTKKYIKVCESIYKNGKSYKI